MPTTTPVQTYPLFEGGQTLTAADLNMLRAVSHHRDRLLGRLIGFGVGCGLRGAVTTAGGATLTIEPGLAVDQVGEPLVLPQATPLSLPPTPSSGTFDFVSAAPGGFSVVLEAEDTIEPTPDCGEVDCEGHAELHTRAAVLRVVPGRITGPRFDFADEPLLAVEPMRLSLTSAPQGSYVTLRDALVTRLTNGGSPLIDPTLITQLQGTSIAPGDLPGVKGYKAGFINQVLFATLDLLRCRALMTTTCDRVTARPGVVLGWLRLQSSTWVWECAYRHAWEPPVGLSQALVGGGCATPCGIWVDALEGLISGYAPPDPPPLDDDDDGGVIVFPVCPKGQVLIGGKCVNIYQPPPKLPEHWFEYWEIDPTLPYDPLGPIWNPPDYHEHFDHVIENVYGGDPWTYFGKETVSGLQTLGRDGGVAKESLEGMIKELGGTPAVTLATAEEVAGMPGYQPGGSFSPSDNVVMTIGANDKVVAIGRVPAAHTARELGSALPEATTKAADALATAGEAFAAAEQIPQVVALAVEEQAAGFGELEAKVQHVLEQADSVLSSQVITGMVQNAVGEYMKVVDVNIGGLQTQINNLYSVKDVVGGGRPGLRLDQDMSLGITEYADTLTAGLGSLVNPENEKTLGRYVKRAQTLAAELRTIAAAGEPIAIGEAAVELLGMMRTAVKAAGVDKRTARDLDAQLDVVKGLLG